MVALRRLEVREVGGVSVARFLQQRMSDELELEEIGQELMQLARTDGRRGLLLNLSSVTFMSSAALGKLIVLNKGLKAQGRVLKMSEVRPEVHEVFAVTGLDRLFDIKKDEAQALADF